MRVLIYGAGAVGCFIGGHLALAGHDVTLLGRDSLRQAVTANGLTLQHADGTRDTLTTLNVVTSFKEAAEGQPFDWIAFTVKAYDTVEALMEIRRVTPEPPPIASFQNGIGNEASIRSAFGQAVAGTLTTPVSMPETGVIVEEKVRGVGVATDADAAKQVVAALQQTQLDLQTVQSEATLKWSKLLLNMLGNAVCAILDMPPDDVFSDPDLFELERLALHEALAIMDLMEVDVVNLPGASAKTLSFGVRHVPSWLLRPILHRKVAGGRGDKLPSLLLDLRSGKQQTEIVWLNGAVAQAADSIERLAPINHSLALILTDITSGRVPWKMYQGKPEMLFTAIRAAGGPAIPRP